VGIESAVNRILLELLGKLRRKLKTRQSPISCVPLTFAIATMRPFWSTRNWVTFAVRLPLIVTLKPSSATVVGSTVKVLVNEPPASSNQGGTTSARARGQTPQLLTRARGAEKAATSSAVGRVPRAFRGLGGTLRLPTQVTKRAWADSQGRRGVLGHIIGASP
jgi:hypothetical protein